MSDTTIRNPEFTPHIGAACDWIRKMGFNGTVPVCIDLPGGRFNAVQYQRGMADARSLYIPTYYDVFRRAVHPTSRAAQRRKHLRVAFTSDTVWYMAYHGPVHRDGQPMIAIPPDMADTYPFGPTVGLAQWMGTEEIDRYETKAYDRVPITVTAGH
jgi:hypothetical protein